MANKPTTNALNTVIEEINGKKAGISSIQAQIEDINSQVQAVLAGKLSIDDFRGLLGSWIFQKGQDFSRSLNVQGIMDTDGANRPGQPPLVQMSLGALDELQIGVRPNFWFFGYLSCASQHNRSDYFSCMCYFFPQVVQDRIMEDIRQKCGESWPSDVGECVLKRRLTVNELHKQRDELKAKAGAIQADIAAIETALRSTGGGQG